MIRTAFGLVNHLLWTTIIGTVAIVISPFDFNGRMIARVTRLWARLLMMGFGIRFKVKGLNLLEPNRHYIFAANHESALDIPLVFAGLPFRLVSMAKQEIKKIPVLGWAMTRARHIFVDRKDHRRARESLDNAAESLKKHPRSVIIFPEGTRSEDGEIHRFKKGGLGLAVDLGIPVVPLAICGTRVIMFPRTMRIRPGTAEIRIGSPIETGSWEGSRKSEFAKLVREKVKSLKTAWSSETAESSRTPGVGE